MEWAGNGCHGGREVQDYYYYTKGFFFQAGMRIICFVFSLFFLDSRTYACYNTTLAGYEQSYGSTKGRGEKTDKHNLNFLANERSFFDLDLTDKFFDCF